MGIYIKGMKCPSCCDECFALDDSDDYPFCMITQKQMGYKFSTRSKRMPHCPLSEVPPHGRLIESNEMKLKLREYEKRLDRSTYDDGTANGIDIAIYYLNNAPTIIEEEK